MTAVLTQRETGGNLSEVLDNLASVIRDRFMVMRQVRTKSAHGRLTGWVLTGLPPVAAVAIAHHQPRALRDDVRGTCRDPDVRRGDRPPDRRGVDHPEAREDRVLRACDTMSALTASMPVEFVVAMAAVFLSVALLVGARGLRRAVAAVTGAASPRVVRRAPPDGPTSSCPRRSRPVTLDPRLARWSRLLPKSPKDMSTLERRLASGGYRSTAALVTFSAAPLLLSAALALGGLVVVWIHEPVRVDLSRPVPAVVGYLAPGFYLDYKISQRRRQIRNGLPDVLDLLIVCLEAGSSLDQSVVKVTEDLAIAYPAMSEELRVLTTETRAGKPRLEAFKNLAQRTKVDDVRALVAMLVQTDRFGTSVAQALRTMADDMRTRRRQAAEEMAAKVGVKLVFPLVFFMFPALFVVILGPAVLQFVRVFSRMQ